MDFFSYSLKAVANFLRFGRGGPIIKTDGDGVLTSRNPADDADHPFAVGTPLEDNHAITRLYLSTSAAPHSTTYDKGLVALVTDEDDHLATNSTITGTPTGDSYVQVAVNGVLVSVGDGAKDKCCYFYGDDTVRNLADVTAGDSLYWMRVIAGYELGIDDTINFYYAS
jgi:hypothetical protein